MGKLIRYKKRFIFCYKWLILRIGDLNKDLNEIVEMYYFDDENLFDTLNFYSSHIHSIADFTGVGKITSLKTIKEIIKVVRLNMMYTNKKELEEVLEEGLAEEELAVGNEKSIIVEDNYVKLPRIESKSREGDPGLEILEQPKATVEQGLI